MTIFLLIIAFLTLYKFKFVKEGINKDYISSNNTKIINGIFVLLVILFSMKVILNSKILSFMGMNVFYIYIYQRIPMMILDGHNVNRYVFIILTFIITLLIGKIISSFEKWLLKKINL